MFVVMEANKGWRTAEPTVEPITLWLSPDAFCEAIEPPPAPPPSAGPMPQVAAEESIF